MEHRFAALGEHGRKIFLYEKDRKKKVREVLWGDWLTVDGEEADGWVRVIWSPNNPEKRRTLYIPKSNTTDKRPLEIVFLDVGQGDGAVLIAPETGAQERIVIVDAGLGDNMDRFINGRFKAYRGFQFEAAVLTHPDEDHYGGFRAIFEDAKVGFRNVYHNGLVERPVSGTWEKLGGLKTDAASGLQYAEDLALTKADIARHFSDATVNGRFVFPGVMHAALGNPKIGDITMLSASHGIAVNGRSYMPGFEPKPGRPYSIEVLGPLAEFDAQGRPRLRKIASYGETKNGHSILLRLQYGPFSILFGGDLNMPAEKFLLTHYSGAAKFPAAGTQAYRDMIALAARRFRSDIMKVCHHGSEKVTDAFLETVHPACFVISSGDQEGHVHPRPDLLGRLGRFGRGESPVLLSTELQRSTRESEDRKLVEGIEKGIARLAEAPTDALRDKLLADVKLLAKTNVDVYGAIYLKTDGERLITAFKIEAGSELKKWFWYEYVFSPSGELTLVS